MVIKLVSLILKSALKKRRFSLFLDVTSSCRRFDLKLMVAILFEGIWRSVSWHRQKRRALPCFDEPALKASFTFHIDIQAPNKALFNMPSTGETALYVPFLLSNVKSSVVLTYRAFPWPLSYTIIPTSWPVPLSDIASHCRLAPQAFG